MKNIFKVIFVIVGTLIGAGFASGKEVYLFFVRYEISGIVGIVVSCSILSFLVKKVFFISEKYELDSYKELTNIILGNKENIGKIMNIIVNMFLLMTFYIMIAGFSTYFEQEYNIPIVISTIIISTLCYTCLINNIEGLVKWSNLLVPIIILIIIIIGIKSAAVDENEFINIYFENNSFFKSIISAVLYASYNSIILIPAIIPLKKYIKYEKVNLTSLIVNLVLIILSLIIYVILYKSSAEIFNCDLPVSYIVRKFGKVYEYIYGIVIVTSIFTSVISAGYGFLENVSKTKKSYTHILIIMCITSLIFANIGFSKLVNILYPIFGLLGIIQIYFLLKTKK